MAGTYGDPGDNEFDWSSQPSINDSNKYSLVYNIKFNSADIYRKSTVLGVPTGKYDYVGQINLSTGILTWHPNSETIISSGDRIKIQSNTGVIYENVIDVISKASGSTKDQSRTFLSNRLNQDLQNQLPTPATPAQGNQGGGTGVSSDNPYAGIDPASLDLLKDQLKDFGDREQNKFNGIKSFLMYPTTIEKGQDKIMIQQLEYVTSGITGSESNITNIGNLLANRDKKFTNILGTVMLPVPNDITETNSTGWGESSLSTIAAALMKEATKTAQGIANFDTKTTTDAVAGLGKNLGSQQVTNRLGQYLAANAGASILKMGGINVDTEAYLSRVTGTSVNPNLELLFSGPKLRQFGFTFKMTPRSEEEARNIRSIIKFFKKGMAPRRSTNEAQSVFLGTPNVFRIKFMSGSNDNGGIGKIKTCALVSCTVNYTPDGFYAAYKDKDSGSQPISTTIQLAFTELTPIYNDEYDALGESSSKSIGPESNFKYVIGPSDGAGNQSAPGSEAGGGRQGPPVPTGRR